MTHCLHSMAQLHYATVVVQTRLAGLAVTRCVDVLCFPSEISLAWCSMVHAQFCANVAPRLGCYIQRLPLGRSLLWWCLGLEASLCVIAVCREIGVVCVTFTRGCKLVCDCMLQRIGSGGAQRWMQDCVCLQSAKALVLYGGFCIGMGMEGLLEVQLRCISRDKGAGWGVLVLALQAEAVKVLVWMLCLCLQWNVQR